jgi:hypothetical protein
MWMLERVVLAVVRRAADRLLLVRSVNRAFLEA